MTDSADIDSAMIEPTSEPLNDGPSPENLNEEKLTSTSTSDHLKTVEFPDKPAQSQQSKPQELPARPETRSNGAQSARGLRSEAAVNGRSPHSLPSRPDVPPVSNRAADQKRNDRPLHDLRDSRFADHRRSDRPSDYPRDTGTDRHGYRDMNRPPPSEAYRHERDAHWSGDKSRGPPPLDDRYGSSSRDGRPLPRDDRIDRVSRDRPHGDSHDTSRSDTAGRRSRDSSMAPPRPTMAPHPDRAGQVQDGNRGYSNSHGYDRPAHENDRFGSQRGSRAGSPSRRDDRPPRSDHSHRDDRTNTDSRRVEDHPSSRSRYDDSRPPTGPRTDRQPEPLQNSQSEKFRESFKSQSSNISSDPSSGRLSQDAPARSQESQYGRLNPDPPSGPRISNGAHGPAGRGGRSVSAVQPALQISTPQNSLPSPTTGERQTPTGPASGRAQQRGSTSFNRPPPASTSAPPTPAAESPDVAGVHPDRLKAIQKSAAAEPATNSRQAPPAAPVGPRGPSNAQPPSPVITGPRGNGPQSLSGNDRTRSDKRFAGLNNVLQQANSQPSPDRSSQGTSIRGRSTRSNNLPASPVTSGPPQRRDHPSPIDPRQDLFPNRPGGPETPHHDDDSTRGRNGNNGRDSDRRPPRRREDRSLSPRRQPNAGPPPHPPPSSSRDDHRAPRRNEEPRDHRGRGSGPQLSERDSRRSLRDEGKERGPRDEWSGTERRGDRDRRGSGGEMSGGGGSGRKRPRGQDDYGSEQGKRSRR